MRGGKHSQCPITPQQNGLDITGIAVVFRQRITKSTSCTTIRVSVGGISKLEKLLSVRSTTLALSLFLIWAGTAMAQTPTHAAQSARSMPSDSEIHKILVDQIDTQKQGVGLVVGVIDPRGRRIISYGALNQGDARPLNADSEFEIGSVTKVHRPDPGRYGAAQGSGAGRSSSEISFGQCENAQPNRQGNHADQSVDA
jgi:hypothetical protein